MSPRSADTKLRRFPTSLRQKTKTGRLSAKNVFSNHFGIRAGVFAVFEKGLLLQALFAFLLPTSFHQLKCFRQFPALGAPLRLEPRPGHVPSSTIRLLESGLKMIPRKEVQKDRLNTGSPDPAVTAESGSHFDRR
jgi:hypothetical protein